MSAFKIPSESLYNKFVTFVICFNKMVASVGIEPTTPRFSVLCSANWAMKPNWRFRRELNPRSLAWQASVITATPRNHIGCGSWIWTNNLWVMSPASYQSAPFRDITYKIYGGERGIRTPAPVTRPPGFQDQSLQPDLGISPKKWCLRPDLNRHGIWLPQDFKSCASTNFATQATLHISFWLFYYFIK